MFKSKHSGWLSDGTRTPLGGKFLSSLDPSKSISNAFAKVDPSPAIGQGLAEVDKTVGNVIPGGWGTIGTAVATYFGGPLGAAFAQGVEGAAKGEDWDKTLADMGKAAAFAYVSGELAEGLNFAGGEQIATDSGKEAFFQSLSQGASGSEAVSAGLSADALASGITAGGTSELMGPTYAELGVPTVDASGAIVNPATGLSWESTGSGLAGNGAQLTPAEFAAQAGVSEITAKDILNNANRAKKLADLISGGGKPNQQQFAQFQQSNQPVQEQFGGLYRMNQNPFAQTQQPTSLQAPLGRTQDFLAQLSEEGKTQPTLADLLRNA
jgi:hypothetical protein